MLEPPGDVELVELCGRVSYLLLQQPGDERPEEEDKPRLKMPCLGHLHETPWYFVKEGEIQILEWADDLTLWVNEWSKQALLHKIVVSPPRALVTTGSTGLELKVTRGSWRAQGSRSNSSQWRPCQVTMGTCRSGHTGGLCDRVSLQVLWMTATVLDYGQHQGTQARLCGGDLPLPRQSAAAGHSDSDSWLLPPIVVGDIWNH